MRSCINGPNLVNIKNSTVKLSVQFPAKDNNGNKCKSYPSARWKHASVVHQNYLYILGGCSWTAILKDLWSLNLVAFSEAVQSQVSLKGFWHECDLHDYNTELWHDLSNFIGDIPPLQSHTMVVYSNQLYIFGGTFVYDARDCPLWIYSLEFQIMRKWKSVGNSEVPVPRRNHSCTVYKDTMLIYGGFGDVRGSFGDLWAFDLKDEKWHLLWCFQKPSKDIMLNISKVGPCPRHDHMAVVHGNCFWIYGGMCGLEECYDLWKWNFDDCQWTRINFKLGPTDVCFINNIIIRQNWVFYCVNEMKKRYESWKYNFRFNKWIYDSSNFLPELNPHSTICLSVNDNDQHISINRYDHCNIGRNKIHPISDVSFNTSINRSSNYLCLESRSGDDNLSRSHQLYYNSNFEKLTPLDLPEKNYAYNNNNMDYWEHLETSFVENINDGTGSGGSITVGVAKLKQYIFLIGNNIDKASFESDICIRFSLLQ